MKNSISMCLLLVITAYTHAQINFTGTVTNQNNEPLAASIYIPQLERGVIAGFDGNYHISNVPFGNYTVIYSFLGYSTVSKKVTFSESSEGISEENTLSIDIIMIESAVEIEEVIISTPFHKLQSDNVMKVERVSTDELESKGAMTLADGIGKISGVNTISTGTGIGKPVIRGLSSNRVLTYTQGVRLENQQFGDEHGLGINGAGIESVEVIKGPASLLYGSDALGGVLYLNPEKFEKQGQTSADLSSTYFSNTSGISINSGIKTSGQKFRFIGRGGYSTHSDYKTGAGSRVTNTRFNESDFKFGAQFHGQKIKSTLRYNYNRSNIGIPEEVGVQSSSKELLSPFQEIDNHIISSNNTLFFTKSSLDVKAGYLFNDRREFEEGEIGPALQLKLRTFNYDVKYNLPDMGNFETIIGLQGMFQKNKNFGEEILIPDATTTDVGILGTTHYHLESIDFQAGLRFDIRKLDSEAFGSPSQMEHIPSINREFNSFNAAFGVKKDFTSNFVGRLNLASGFRAPNLSELASNGVHEGTNRYEIGNPNLNNEQNFQLDVSLEFKNEHFEVAANGFYNAIDDYIFILPTDFFIEENMVFEYVQANANLFGGEFGLHIHPHPLDWLHIESSFETVTGKLKEGNYLPLIPANTLRNTLRIEFDDSKIFKDSFSFIELTTAFDQNKVNDFESATNGYSLLTMGASSNFEFDKLTLHVSANVTNLTNETYVSHLSRLKTDGIPNIGRSFNLNLKLEI